MPGWGAAGDVSWGPLGLDGFELGQVSQDHLTDVSRFTQAIRTSSPLELVAGAAFHPGLDEPGQTLTS